MNVQLSHFRILLILTLCVFLAFMTSLFVGPVAIDISNLWALIKNEPLNASTMILWEIRFPRAILGLLVGASLGISGAALQGYLRNPLAEPGIIGVSSSAALGAVLMLYSGLALWFPMALPLGGMCGALIGVGIIHFLAGRNGTTLSLILAGVAVSGIASAMMALALNFSPSPWAALEIVFWLMGSLENRSFEHVQMATPLIIAGWIILLSLKRPLDAMTLGEDTATTMGFNMSQVRIRLIFGTALCVGAATSVAGAIGFVGLVVPHLLRPWLKHRPGALLVASALGGALMLLMADIMVRMLSSHNEIKLGVLTAIVGAPFFLWLILKLRKQVL